MTSLTFVSRTVCVVCRCRLGGITLGSYRINKTTIRATSVSLIASVRVCPECGHPAAPVDTWAPDAESAEKIRAARVKKGWQS